MTAKEPETSDVVLLNGPTEDGGGVQVVRAREGKVEIGEVRPLVHGKPITGEVVTLTPRPDTPRVCDVQVQISPPTARSGPAQIATATYRNNWDATFGEGPPKKSPPTALN
jgi:hypothetical protein